MKRMLGLVAAASMLMPACHRAAAPCEPPPHAGAPSTDGLAVWTGTPVYIPPPSSDAAEVLTGQAVYYGDSLSGNLTASGQRYDPRLMTAAHRSLPFGTLVRVIRVDTGRWVDVVVNDRGPFGEDKRIIDVSKAAAERLDMIRAGVVDVRVEVFPARGG